ncbi:RING finger protein 121 [Adelges cooleyi]|uniref:RING finger protein 121 n=1 Tax=Adelges cooleyi TaxID=133065 RepID=UPI00217FB1EE|nr:RING finger protein 121 [Adelges cooleyi]
MEVVNITAIADNSAENITMTREEIMRENHRKLHEEHKGHESMHAEMLLILLVTMIIAQITLLEWKRRHFKSFQIVTSLALWSVPFVMCVIMAFWRFIIFWILFSLLTGIVVRKALQKPLQGSTPRLVYKWFYFIYKLTYVLGIIGYSIMILSFFGISVVFNVNPAVWVDCGLLIMYYGLYFGVLGQDVAEICASTMASNLGYYTPQGIPTRSLEKNICAVCGNKLLLNAGEEGIIESTFQLTCDHIFHEFCIRGWCIVGKKQTCPYCKEKVDLKRMFRNPWEKPHVLYGQLLDWLRWFVAWGPIINGLIQIINHLLGLK